MFLCCGDPDWSWSILGVIDGLIPVMHGSLTGESAQGWRLATADAPGAIIT